MLLCLQSHLPLVQQLPVLWQGSCHVAAALSGQARHLSVLSWGRNVEGQCGVEGDVPVVAKPLPILNLHGAQVSSIHAGTLNSAAVLCLEEIYTWGDGSSGKLGHGNGDSISNPSRIEAFVGRTAINSVALGQHHSLFLGSDGHLWACGENKEGQCGFGLPLEVLASRYRKAYYESIRPPAPVLQHAHTSSDRYAQYLRTAVSNGAAGPAASAATAGVASAGSYVAQGWGDLFGSSSNSRSSRSHHQQQQQQSLQQLFGLPKQPGHAAAAAAAGFDIGGPSTSSGFSHGLGKGLFSASSSHGNGSISSHGVWAAADMETMLHSTRIHAGQTAVPTRVAAEQSTVMGLTLGSSSSSTGVDDTNHDSLGHQRVVGVSASKFFSLAVTDKGEVWAWGADYNGALGSEASWVGSAQRVAAPISGALAAAGGAVAVAAGSTFSAALTAAGTVLVWGKLGGGSPAAPGLTAAAAAHAATDSTDNSSVSSMFAQVALPDGVHVSSISAGQQHLLLTDGDKVWVIGRWLDGMGDEIGVASWDQPHEVISLRKQDSSTSSSDKIVKVVAGMHSSAAVTAEGRLWLWGRLLDEQRGSGIVRRFGGEKYVNGVNWGWAGFGGAEPRLVDGIAGVRDIALGGWHAMVLVD